jgi:adenylate kinase
MAPNWARRFRPSWSPGHTLDGYPRTPEQVDELDRILGARGARLDAVIQLVADVDEVVERLRKRALTEGRADDTEEVLRHRQEVYAEQTAPLIDVYGERGLVVAVDALGEVDDVTERIVSALAAR